MGASSIINPASNSAGGKRPCGQRRERMKKAASSNRTIHDPVRDQDSPWVQRYIHDEFATAAERKRIEAEIAETRAELNARSVAAERAAHR
jgi:hypothetical protein